MNDLVAYAPIAGRLLLGGVFVFGGLEHFRNFSGVRAMMAGRGFPFPGTQLAVASALEVVAGIALQFHATRFYAALFLIVFTIAASVTLLNFWTLEGEARSGVRSGFIINVAVIGGLLLAMV